MAVKYLNKDTGSDANNGNSAGAAYATLDYALGQLGAGDTLYIASSTTDYVWTDKTIPNGVSLIGDTEPNPVKGTYARINAGGNHRKWTLSGSFTARNLWFYNNLVGIAESQFYPDRTQSGTFSILFEDCILSHMNSNQSTATRGGIIGGGNSLYDGVHSITLTLRRCAFFNLEGQASGAGALVRPPVSWTVLFDNCTYYSGTPTAFALGALVANNGSTPVVTYRNCIIENQSGSNIYLQSASSTAGSYTAQSATVSYCLYRNIVTTNLSISNSLTSDPQLLDVSNHDFRLKPTSPAINAGVLV